MKQKQIEELLEQYETEYHNKINNLATKVFISTVIPFAKSRKLDFIAGMGTYCFWTQSKKYIDLKRLSKFTEIFNILETNVNGQRLGTLMPDFRYNNYIFN